MDPERSVHLSQEGDLPDNGASKNEDDLILISSTSERKREEPRRART
jgi:hypothetical protein